MGFSAFSKPLGRARLGAYSWGGSLLGAGAGAALSRDDHRVSGAVVGGAVGNVAGWGLAAAHAYSGNYSDLSDNLMRGVRDLRAGNFRGAANWLPIMGKKAMRNPNITPQLRSDLSALRSDIGRGASYLSGIMSRFRR